MRLLKQSYGSSLTTLLVVFLLLYGSQATSTLTPPPLLPTLTPRSLQNGTCEYRTVNYITHSLPYVCLRNGRVGVLADSRITTEMLTIASTPSSPDEAKSTRHDTATTTVMPEATVTTSPKQVSDSMEDDDVEALDQANFMSFEDWKKQTQEKAGHDEERRKRDGSHDTLDMSQEDEGIEMDIHAIIGEQSGRNSRRPREQEQDSNLRAQKASEPTAAAEKARYRSKDAGKTCKERFNFASVDAGGQIMKANLEAKSTSALLKENRDVYMLNVCQAKNKFIIVELSDSIYVETVALANFEFFSSTFRQFRVSVSAKYPVKLDKWSTLGTFEAQNTRDIQAFLVESPLIEARYLRIEFLNHYGNEFYCPVSLLRVHGQTMLQEVMSWERAASGEDDDDEVEEAEIAAEERPAAGDVEDIEFDDARVADGLREAQQALEQLVETANHMSSEALDNTIISEVIESLENATILQTTSPLQQQDSSGRDFFSDLSFNKTCALESTTSTAYSTTTLISNHSLFSNIPKSEFRTTESQTNTQLTSTSVISVAQITDTTTSIPSLPETSLSVLKPTASATSTSSITSISGQSQNGTISSINRASATSSAQSVKSTKTTSSASVQPTTQESFFKTVTKRLQLLEANSTLSLKYIEEQSRILREAFNKVEKRQLSKTTTFLENLNNSVLAELHRFGQNYDQMWQSTVIELETQRDQNKRETEAVTARLNLLADELIFQKRMSIIQSVLLLLCLGIVVFSRGVAGGYIDLPAIQSMLAKSRSPSRFGFDSLVNSPINRNSSFRGDNDWTGPRHRRQHSPASTRSRRSISRENSPPTPFSTYSRLENERGLYDDTSETPFKERDVLFDHAPRDQIKTPSGTTKTSCQWHDREIISKDALPCSLPALTNVTPKKLHTLRHSSGSISLGSPNTRVNGNDYDASPVSLKSNNDCHNSQSVSGQFDAPNMLDTTAANLADTSALGEATSRSHGYLPSPPPDSERSGFMIARKPLPALPQD